MSRRLVIWDVDGTLVDSADEIAVVMGLAFADEGVPAPAPDLVRGIIGLTLPLAIAQLSPGLQAAQVARIADGYRAHFGRRSVAAGIVGSPLFPGIRAVLEMLAAEGEVDLAVATGKSRQGLMPILEGHGLTGLFASIQVSDDHPSKPHPAMIHAAMAEVGANPARTVMVGDTTFDMEMARTAGVAALGVAWGYHRADTLVSDALAHEVAELPALIARLSGGTS